MSENKRGKPQQWTDEELQKIALEVKYKFPHSKLNALQLEKETGIGRNTWSRRMKDFINQLNMPIYMPSLKEGGIITIPTVEELFENYGDNMTSFKNEIAKLFNIINDLYSDAKQVESLKASIIKLQSELDSTKEKLNKFTEQKLHFETLYNQIVAESYFPHLYGGSEKLKKNMVKSPIVPLPLKNEDILKLNDPTINGNPILNEDKIDKINKKFNLDL